MTLTVGIGYDSKEPAAFAVACHSLLTRASKPITILPLTLKAVAHCYTRPRGATEATEFSLTRFLVPSLVSSPYAIFMDCDMLVRCDIWDVMLHVLADPGKAVYVCPHDYVPKSATKFLGQAQTVYPRKNWSSFMVFDVAQCREILTPDYVNTATGADLHRFAWLRDDQIGHLPLDWNWLVGEYEPKADARILHYTLGGPWFTDCQDTDHADDWRRAYDAMRGDG